MLVIFAFYFTEKKYHTVLFSWRENDTDTISLKLCALKRLSTFRYKFVPCWCFQFYSHLLLCSVFVLQWITFPTTKLQACTNIEGNCLYINCQANKGQAMFASTPRQYKTQEQANKIAASNMKCCTNCISFVSAMKVPVTQNIRDWMLGSHSPSNMKAQSSPWVGRWGLQLHCLQYSGSWLSVAIVFSGSVPFFLSMI